MTTSSKTRRRFQARLFGGPADGCLVRLANLSARVAVYRNGAGASAKEPAFADHPAAEGGFVGYYELVEPLGPETPTYVASSS
jgi:hypothetical protein